MGSKKTNFNEKKTLVVCCLFFFLRRERDEKRKKHLDPIHDLNKYVEKTDESHNPGKVIIL